MRTIMTKRQFMTTACCVATAVGFTAQAVAEDTHVPVPAGLSPDEALALLKKGNEDFLSDEQAPPAHNRKRRLEIANEQHPFAVLVGCSDSRVSPEVLFGRGLGDLFIVRVAGNTVDLTGLGSIEYAVDHLGVPLIVVMGHERCGAVSAAVAMVKDNAVYDSAIEAMVAPIVPAVLQAQRQSGDLLDNSVRENVRHVVTRLTTSGPVIGERLTNGKLKIVGARYDLDDGKVEFFS